MAKKPTATKLESLSRAELIALVKILHGHHDLYIVWARREVVDAEVKALAAAHKQAAEAVAPYRVKLQTLDPGGRAWPKAYREYQAKESEEKAIWKKLEAAWEKWDRLRAEEDAVMEAERAKDEARKGEAAHD